MRQVWSERRIDGAGHFQRLLVGEIQHYLSVAHSVVYQVDLGPVQILVELGNETGDKGGEETELVVS